MMTQLSMPQAFRYAGCYCGIKQDAGSHDMALIWSERSASAAGVYTTNQVVAAPVIVNRRRTPLSDARAVVINSGNANACTGEEGLANAHTMLQWTAQRCRIREDQVLVLSTGIIGQQLPMTNISQGIEQLVDVADATEQQAQAAARGMMTTDTRPKIRSLQFRTNGSPVTILGMAKGAGMIGPRMATLLGIVTTDLAVTAQDSQRLLSDIVEQTFNCVSVEGHMSTNDTVLLLANGASGQQLSPATAPAFTDNLLAICTELAKSIADDGEGATHMVEIMVSGAADHSQARHIARTIADSPLVKTAIAGNDPNWGRIISAAGYAGPRIAPQRLSLRLNGFLLYEHGAPAAFSPQTVSTSLANQRHTLIELHVGQGHGTGHCWTCDLTYEYVRINAEYHT